MEDCQKNFNHGLKKFKLDKDKAKREEKKFNKLLGREEKTLESVRASAEASSIRRASIQKKDIILQA